MAKAPKKEADDAEAGKLDTADTATATVAAAEPAVEPAKLTFSSAKPPSLADLNAAAYKAHKADSDVKKRASEAAVKAAQDVLSKII